MSALKVCVLLCYAVQLMTMGVFIGCLNNIEMNIYSCVFVSDLRRPILIIFLMVSISCVLSAVCYFLIC